MGAAVVARCNASPVFEFTKHILDFVSLFVEHFVVAVLDFFCFSLVGSTMPHAPSKSLIFPAVSFNKTGRPFCRSQYEVLNSGRLLIVFGELMNN